MTPTSSLRAHDSQDLIDREHICDWLKIGIRTLDRWISIGTFPRPIALTSHEHRWKRLTVQAWIDGRQT